LPVVSEAAAPGRPRFRQEAPPTRARAAVHLAAATQVAL
jgi:hypothetical protein